MPRPILEHKIVIVVGLQVPQRYPRRLVDDGPLSKTSYIYTFHREGLFDFRCAVHQPEMNGQILVLPPRMH